MTSSKRLTGVLLVAVVLGTSIVGCNFLKKAQPDAGSVEVEAAATVATAAPSDDQQVAPLPLECENYLAQYTCYLTKTSKDLKAADDMRTSLSLAAVGSRQSAVDMCNGQLTAKASEFKAQGCAAAPITTATAAKTVAATAKTDAGVHDASTPATDASTATTATPATDASTATTATADAGKRCTRPQECPETDACENNACVKKCTGQVWVDSAKACGDVCSSSALLGKKCADGFVCTPHGRGVGGCIKK